MAYLENLQTLESILELLVVVLEVVFVSSIEHHLSQPKALILIYKAFHTQPCRCKGCKLVRKPYQNVLRGIKVRMQALG